MASSSHSGARLGSHRTCLALPLVALLLALPACAGNDSGSGDDDGSACTGSKCDLPGGEDSDLCQMRRVDAFNENHNAFTHDYLRWSCNDVDGVTREDRGQEYCEYFAIAQLPPPEQGAPAPPASVLGLNLGADYSAGTTETSVQLTANQLDQLEHDSAQVVGQCVFTSWNSDIPGPVPACQDPAECPDVLGVPVDAETFRMKFDVNSAQAGQQLVEDCYTDPDGGDPANAADPLNDDFTRGCLYNAQVNDTAFRKSDTTVCAASMRLSECGCAPTGDETFEQLVSPFARRGFPLGTWSDPHGLPAGCRFVDLGDDSQTVVTCDLTAADVVNWAPDLKGRCQTKYADNVVVHVPMPDQVACTPEGSPSPYASTCTATPWVLEP